MSEKDYKEFKRFFEEVQQLLNGDDNQQIQSKLHTILAIQQRELSQEVVHNNFAFITELGGKSADIADSILILYALALRYAREHDKEKELRALLIPETKELVEQTLQKLSELRLTPKKVSEALENFGLLVRKLLRTGEFHKLLTEKTYKRVKKFLGVAHKNFEKIVLLGKLEGTYGGENRNTSWQLQNYLRLLTQSTNSSAFWNHLKTMSGIKHLNLTALDTILLPYAFALYYLRRNGGNDDEIKKLLIPDTETQVEHLVEQLEQPSLEGHGWTLDNMEAAIDGFEKIIMALTKEK